MIVTSTKGKNADAGDIVLNNPDTELNFDDSKQDMTKNLEKRVPYSSDEKTIEVSQIIRSLTFQEFVETEKFHLNNNSNPVVTPKQPRNGIIKTGSEATEEIDTPDLISPQRRIQSAPVKHTKSDFPRVWIST